VRIERIIGNREEPKPRSKLLLPQNREACFACRIHFRHTPIRSPSVTCAAGRVFAASGFGRIKSNVSEKVSIGKSRRPQEFEVGRIYQGPRRVMFKSVAALNSFTIFGYPSLSLSLAGLWAVVRAHSAPLFSGVMTDQGSVARVIYADFGRAVISP
jgi:hypothetical protein